MKNEFKGLEFGDYISVEQKRFGAENEHYTHKVIGCLKSNTWIDAPAVLHNGAVIHDTIEPVVNCICEGVSEDTVIRYRVCDVKKINKHSYKQLAEQNKELLEALKEISVKINSGKWYMRSFTETDEEAQKMYDTWMKLQTAIKNAEQ